MNLKLGDAVTELKTMPPGSIDLILTDPPYGATKNSWDRGVGREQFEVWFDLLFSVAKPNAIIASMASGPLLTYLLSRKEYRFRYIWVKNQATGAMHAARRPLAAFEDIVVMCKGTKWQYHPQLSDGHPPRETWKARSASTGRNYGNHSVQRKADARTGKTTRYPTSVITDIPCVPQQSKDRHPTQKPVELMEYLIKTFSRPGDLILDPFMGSGTTGVACVRTGRRFVGVEADEGFFGTAKERVGDARKESAVGRKRKASNTADASGPRKRSHTPQTDAPVAHFWREAVRANKIAALGGQLGSRAITKGEIHAAFLKEFPASTGKCLAIFAKETKHLFLGKGVALDECREVISGLRVSKFVFPCQDELKALLQL
eukprot:TRINITY_DN13699_c0_g1_i1.p1 TRINITY_DN13699_c0_g1~~TRINITY_DN13699_c0_g1_i1.p1  ORF type:complete len:374 (+),score=53.27 TRINITY_DN13699_c0_g1_i1:127-1248(+)